MVECVKVFFVVVFIFYFDKDQVVQCDPVQMNLIPGKAFSVGSSRKILQLHKSMCEAIKASRSYWTLENGQPLKNFVSDICFILYIFILFIIYYLC